MEHNEQIVDVHSAMRRLYPDLTNEEVTEAVENLTRYLDVVKEIYERLQSSHELQGQYEQLKRMYIPSAALDGPGDSGSFSAPESG